MIANVVSMSLSSLKASYFDSLEAMNNSQSSTMAVRTMLKPANVTGVFEQLCVNNSVAICISMHRKPLYNSQAQMRQTRLSTNASLQTIIYVLSLHFVYSRADMLATIIPIDDFLFQNAIVS